MKRKRVSSDPKLKKRCRLSQQTVSVENMAENEEKVALDYLLLVKIASLMKLTFAPVISQELISSTFANALHSFCYSKKIKLTITSPSPCTYKVDLSVVLLSISDFSHRCKEEMRVKNEDLNKAVEQIFTRFPQINLKLEGYEGLEDTAFAVFRALNVVPNATIECLEIDSCYTDIVLCYELLEKLSSNLRVLNLHMELSLYYGEAVPMSEQFWQTVSSCAKLVRLSATFNGLHQLLAETLVMRVSKCLQLLKIEYFRTDLRGGDDVGSTDVGSDSDSEDSNLFYKRTMEWLSSAFEKNENLRQLELSNSSDSFAYWGNFGDIKYASLVLSRLNSLKFHIVDGGFDREWKSHFKKILPALSDHALLKISLVFAFIYSETMPKQLRMYLKLSHQTARRIKLRLICGSHNMHGINIWWNEALNQLSSTDEFRGLKTILCGKWTRFLFGNANLMVKFEHRYKEIR